MTDIPNEWQLQEAKNKLSQLIKAANQGVPQYITVHGKSAAVILSAQDYERLSRPQTKLSSTLLMPLFDDEDDDPFTRDADFGRDLDL
jgi:prevent-host-death family protein